MATCWPKSPCPSNSVRDINQRGFGVGYCVTLPNRSYTIECVCNKETNTLPFFSVTSKTTDYLLGISETDKKAGSEFPTVIAQLLHPALCFGGMSGEGLIPSRMSGHDGFPNGEEAKDLQSKNVFSGSTSTSTTFLDDPHKRKVQVTYQSLASERIRNSAEQPFSSASSAKVVGRSSLGEFEWQTEESYIL